MTFTFILFICVCKHILSASVRMLGLKLCVIVPGFLCLCKWTMTEITVVSGIFMTEYAWFFFTPSLLGWILEFELQLPWYKEGEATPTLYTALVAGHTVCA